MKYIKALPYAKTWFSDKPITVGKIYEFPDITFDNGTKGSLNPDEQMWQKEFEFLSQHPDELPTYEIY